MVSVGGQKTKNTKRKKTAGGFRWRTEDRLGSKHPRSLHLQSGRQEVTILTIMTILTILNILKTSETFSFNTKIRNYRVVIVIR